MLPIMPNFDILMFSRSSTLMATVLPYLHKQPSATSFFFLLLVNEKTGNIFSSPTPPLPTMLFLFLFGSLDKHLLCESDKPYPKPQRELQPKATNWGRP